MNYTIEDRIIDLILQNLDESNQTTTDSNYSLVQQIAPNNYHKVAVSVEHIMTSSGLFDMPAAGCFKLTNQGLTVKAKGGLIAYKEYVYNQEKEKEAFEKAKLQNAKRQLWVAVAAIVLSIMMFAYNIIMKFYEVDPRIRQIELRLESLEATKP